MTHGDDSGLVLPPNVAPTQLVIVPIFRIEEDRAAVAQRSSGSRRRWPTSRPLRVRCATRSTGARNRRASSTTTGSCAACRFASRSARATWPPARECWYDGSIARSDAVSLDGLPNELPQLLADYQADLLQRARDFHAANTHFADTYDEFKAVLEKEGGFLLAPWCGDGACEKQVNADTGATIRVIPFDSPAEEGKCLVDGRPSERRVLFARAY